MTVIMMILKRRRNVIQKAISGTCLQSFEMKRNQISANLFDSTPKLIHKIIP